MSNSQNRKQSKNQPGDSAKKRPANVVSSARRSTGGGRGSQQMTFIIVASLVAIVAIVGGIIAVKRTSDNKAAQAASNDQKVVTQLKKDVAGIASAVPAELKTSTVTPDAIIVGNPDAKVTIDLWVDLQCSSCKAYEAQNDPTLEAAVKAGTAVLQVRPVAILDQMSSGTRYSSRAGNAVVCAAQEGLFWPYAKALYQFQPDEGATGLPNDRLVLIARAVGLTSDSFQKCVDTEAQKPWITQMTKNFDAKKLQGTPSVFVNGKQLTAGTTAELTSAIAAATATA
ncbi:MAG: thioredoxin domain-containing protein [Antricoccus sp.]